MITITLKVDALPGEAQGVKECIAAELERFGAVRVVEVKADVPWQLSLFGNLKGEMLHGKQPGKSPRPAAAGRRW